MKVKNIEDRITDLQTDWSYYTRPRQFSLTFTPEAHIYYKSIPVRLEELNYLLENFIIK